MSKEGKWPTGAKLDEATIMELIPSAQAGDIKSQQLIVESIYGAALHVAKKYALCGEELRDLFHTAIVGAYEALRRYKINKVSRMSFKTYAYYIMRFHIFAHLRRQNDIIKRVFYDHEMEIDFQELSEKSAGFIFTESEESEIVKLVRTTLTALPMGNLRTVMISRILDGKKFREIGEFLGLTRGRAHQIWQEGVAMLREKIEEIMDV